MTPIGRFSVASETSQNPSIITFFMTLRGAPLSAPDLKELWQEKTMAERHPRFHQVVVREPHLTFRAEDPTMTNRHWIETTYPANQDDLRKRLQRMQVDRWDLADSLWYMSVGSSANQQRGGGATENKQPQEEEDETILLFRGHHGLADGASMMAAISDLYDESDELRAEIERKVKEFKLYRRQKRYKSLLDRMWSYWVKLVKFVAGALLMLLRQIWLVALDAYWDANPWAQLKALQQTKGKMQEQPAERTVAWSDFAPVEDVRRVAKALGSTVTVNDVMVACATAALAKQLERHRMVHDVEMVPYQKSVHVTVPVHLKGGVILPHESVGNNLGAVMARVPCEIPSTQENSATASLCRIKWVHEELSWVKRTPGAVVGYGMAVGLSWLSHILPLASMFETAHAGSVLVVSNVRGPDRKLHVQGREIDQMYGFVPLPPGIPIGIVVQSYDGTVSCTLTAEPWAVPDGDQFLIWMMKEYKQLVQVVNDHNK
jgi:hypothetical protein